MPRRGITSAQHQTSQVTGDEVTVSYWECFFNLSICAISGSPRLKEKVGQYLQHGDLICLVEEPTSLQAEIVLSEQQLSRVHSGHPVAPKARALPIERPFAR